MPTQKGKAPATMLYWNDLIHDTLRLDPASMGAWVRILGHLFWSDTKGQSTETLEEWTRIIGATDLNETARILTALGDPHGGEKGIGNVTPLPIRYQDVTDRYQKVTVGNRRMLRETAEHKANADKQKEYRKRKSAEPQEPPLPESNPPSSSSLPSSSSFANSEDKKDISKKQKNQQNSDRPRPRTSSDRFAQSFEQSDPRQAQLHVAWNKGCEKSGLMPIQDLPYWRRDLIMNAFQDTFFAENWQAAIAKLPDCPFLCGKGTKPFTLGFDTFLKPEMFRHIMEDQYKGKKHRHFDHKTGEIVER